MSRQSALTDEHRMFNQLIMANKIMSSRDVRDACSKLTKGNSGDFDLVSFLATVNRSLEPFSMNVVKGKAEDTGDTYYALVNTSPDAASKLATGFTEAELEFLHQVVEKFVSSEDGTVNSTDLMNISIERKLTKTDVQSLLKRLTKEKWLSEVEDTGDYSPGIRFILELGPYLRESFGDDEMFKCPVCSALVIRGVVCADCLARIHLYCATKLFGDRASASCPRCREPWKGRQVSAQPHRKRSAATSLSDNNGDVVNGNDEQGPSGLSNDEIELAKARRYSHYKKPKRSQ